MASTAALVPDDNAVKTRRDWLVFDRADVPKNQFLPPCSPARFVLYQEEDKTAPLRVWLKEIPPKAAFKCLASIDLLKSLGHVLRRPQADLLRDGIHELRVGFQGIHYRILYFFHGNVAAVVSHGLTKERAVPSREIELAIKRRARFLADPTKHTSEDK